MIIPPTAVEDFTRAPFKFAQTQIKLVDVQILNIDLRSKTAAKHVDAERDIESQKWIRFGRGEMPRVVTAQCVAIRIGRCAGNRDFVAGAGQCEEVNSHPRRTFAVIEPNFGWGRIDNNLVF